MKKSPKYAFYGTLRRGMSNYLVYKDQLEYIKTVTLKGFKLYLGEYPYAIRSNNMDDRIVVELFVIKDNLAEQTIYEMEIEAGYIFDEVKIAEEKFGIYIFHDQNRGGIQIPSGDWVQYVSQFDF